jgi:ABC-type branched-subunit amino acid transport system ATPase component/ABC-type branched-subunit amino acid transport system permease subunit
MAGLGLNLLLGYSGLVSFGHAAWFGLGGYAVAIIQLRFFPNESLIPLVLALLVTSLISLGIGALILRRRGVYFSLLTLAFSALIFTVAFRWTALTGGENGLGGIERREWFGLQLNDPIIFYSIVAASAMVVAAFLLRVVNSPFGRVLVAIRENEQRVRFIGFPVRYYQLIAFVISASVTGLAGALFVLNHRIASAELVSVPFSGELLAMALIGGMRSFSGPIIGAIFFLLFREYLSQYTENWLFYFGIVFVGFILLSPAGLAGLGRRVRQLIWPDKVRAGAMAFRSTPTKKSPLPAFLGHRPSQSLTVDSVSKSFGGVQAVHNVSLSVEPQGLHALIGPNGAGKTSLFNLISGQFSADAGRISLGGSIVAMGDPTSACKRGLCRSFQITNLFKSLTVRENLWLSVMARDPKRFSLLSHADTLDKTHKETEELVQFLGVSGMEEAVAEDLSYGGQRLVDMGLALGGGPTVLLLDEPLAGLSASERQRVGQLIRQLADHLAVFLVEHDVDRVFELSDKITVMSQGAVLIEGDASRVRDDHQVREIYIGSGTAALTAKVPSSILSESVLLRVSSLEVFYGKSHILSDINLIARSGEIIAVLGRNGAGKSTLLKSLIGLAKVGEGSIEIAGFSTKSPIPEVMARRGIAFVPQGRRLFSGLTVRDNLMLGRLERGGNDGSGWSDQKIFSVFPRLKERYLVNADVLSGGEQQMVAIARALAGDAKVLLLDEPFEGLSPAMTEEVFNAVLRLKGEVTTLIVDHNLDLALAIADSTVVLDRGRISYVGAALPLLSDLSLRREKLWV